MNSQVSGFRFQGSEQRDVKSTRSTLHAPHSSSPLPYPRSTLHAPLNQSLVPAPEAPRSPRYRTRPRHGSGQAPSSSGFTLIELMVVMTIIAILSGIVLGTSNYANQKAMKGRAQAEIAALENALESYKNDKGQYPVSATQVHFPYNNPASIVGAKTLFTALSGNSAGTGLIPDATNRAYFTELNEGKNGNVKKDTSDSTYYFIDPYGFPYCYISGNTAIQTNRATFDLWSLGPDALTEYAKDKEDDIGNWAF